MNRRARAVLAVACGAHFIHDGFSDILYVLLPVWATEFGLSFAQVGLLKTLYTGGMASFQVPARHPRRAARARRACWWRAPRSPRWASWSPA